MLFRIKAYPEDFVVDEMLADGRTASALKVKGGEGPFLWVALKKTSWNTIDLAREIAKRAGVGEKRVNYGGIKDRNAVAYQVFSVKSSDDGIIEKVSRIRDVEPIAWWREGGWIKSDDIAGNAFAITLRECNFFARDVLARHTAVFPNYFGEQRFGSIRGNSADIGLLLLKGNYEGAVLEYFGLSNHDEKCGQAGECENRLGKNTHEHGITSGVQGQTGDYDKDIHSSTCGRNVIGSALGQTEECDKGLYNNSDPAVPINRKDARLYREYKRLGARRFVEHNWRLFKLFAHAFQSKMFNEELEMRINAGDTGVLEGEYTCGANLLGFADIKKEGGQFVVAELAGGMLKRPNKYKTMLLDKYGLCTGDFARLQIKGGWRVLYAPVLDLQAEDAGDGVVRVRFKLQKGSYATVVLKELLTN